MKSELTGASYNCGREPQPSLGRLLAEALKANAHDAFIEVDPTEQSRTVTLAEQWKRAESLWGDLLEHEVEPGSTLILCFESSLDLIAATWAAIAHRCNIYAWHVYQGNARTLNFEARSKYLHGCLGPCWLVTTIDLASRFPRQGNPSHTGVIVTSFEGHSPVPGCSPPQEETTSFFLQTSGTTGEPRLAKLSFQAAAKRQIGRLRNRTGNFEVGMTYMPFDNITAMFDMLPVYPASVLVHPDCFPADPLSILRMVSRHRVETMNMSSSVAASLVKELRKGNDKLDLSSLKALRYGLEPIVPSVIRNLDESLKERTDSPLKTIFGYGLTETGLLSFTELTTLDHLINANTGSPWVSLGGCAFGKSVRVVDEKGDLVPQSVIGLIEAKLEMGSIDGFLDESGILHPLETTEGWLDTGDLGFIEDGALTVTGRKKELLIVRGRNISLPGVEEALRGIDGIQIDHLVASAIESDKMVIFFSAGIRDEEEKQSVARKLLLAAADFSSVSPEAVVHIPPSRFPLTATGKINRSALVAGFHSGTFAPVSFDRAPPIHSEGECDTTNLRKLSQIWQTCLQLDHLPGSEANFYELGGDSMKAVSLLRTISTTFQKEIDTARFFESPTVGECYEWLQQTAPAHQDELTELKDSPPFIHQLRPGQNKRPLFLFPGGMGTKNELLVFANLAKHFKTDLSVIGFEAPHAEWREGEELTAVNLASRYVAEIKKIQPLGPYLICGECIAGVIAFEVSKQLLQGGEQLKQLILLDPIFASRKGFRNFRKTGFKRLEKVHGASLAMSVFPYYLALYAYRPSRLKTSVTVLMTRDAEPSRSTTSIWEKKISGSLTTIPVPGDHDSYIREHASETARTLEQVMTGNF